MTLMIKLQSNIIGSLSHTLLQGSLLAQDNSLHDINVRLSYACLHRIAFGPIDIARSIPRRDADKRHIIRAIFTQVSVVLCSSPREYLVLISVVQATLVGNPFRSLCRQSDEWP